MRERTVTGPAPVFIVVLGGDAPGAGSLPPLQLLIKVARELLVRFHR